MVLGITTSAGAIIVGQGPTVLAVVGYGLDIFFSPITALFFVPLSRERLDID